MNVACHHSWMLNCENGWLQGYGSTLGTINGLAVLTSIFQAIPLLAIQWLTLVAWMVARFFMYSR